MKSRLPELGPCGWNISGQGFTLSVLPTLELVPSLYRATSLETCFQSEGVLSLTAINTA